MDVQLVADALDWAPETVMREATYQAGDRTIYYEGADTWEDITDLYTLLEQHLETGSPNLENAQIEKLADVVASGRSLSDVDIGVLVRLLKKYEGPLAELRATPGKGGQDYTDVPDPATARIVSDGGDQ